MKHISSLLLITTILFVACNNNKTKVSNTAGNADGKDSASQVNLQNAFQDVEKQKEELSKLQPLNLDQLKALIPESLMGAKSTNVEVNSSMGAGLAHAEYELNDSTRIKLNIYDCAGPAGAGIYSMQYLGMNNLLQDNEDEFTRAIDFNDNKAFEQCEKATNDCTFSYFSGDRFMVTLEAGRIGIEALKQAARGLNIK